MTRMTGPDCVVMCNLINTHTHTHTHTPHRHKHTPTAYSRPRYSTMSNAFASGSALGSLVRDYMEEELAESCSSSSSESSGSKVEIEKVQPSASAGGGGGAAGSCGARAAPAPAPQARKSTQTGIAGFFSKPTLAAQQRKAKEKRAEQRKKDVAAAVANPTAPERAAHIDKTRVVRTHTERFRRNEAKRSRQKEEKEEEEEDGKGGGRSKRSKKRKSLAS